MAETTFRSSSDRVLAVLCHLGCLFGLPLIFPLIVYLCTKSDGSLLTDNAREALNFHISLFIYALVGGVLLFVGIGLLILWAIWFAAIIFAIIAAVKVSNSGFYKYPIIIRMV